MKKMAKKTKREYKPKEDNEEEDAEDEQEDGGRDLTSREVTRCVAGIGQRGGKHDWPGLETLLSKVSIDVRHLAARTATR